MFNRHSADPLLLPKGCRRDPGHTGTGPEIICAFDRLFDSRHGSRIRDRVERSGRSIAIVGRVTGWSGRPSIYYGV